MALLEPFRGRHQVRLADTDTAGIVYFARARKSLDAIAIKRHHAHNQRRLRRLSAIIVLSVVSLLLAPHDRQYKLVRIHVRRQPIRRR